MTTPLPGNYLQKVVRRQAAPSQYFYSNGSGLFLIRCEETECDFVNVRSNFLFSYLIRTGHELIIRPRTKLKTTNGQTCTEWPYSNLPEGIYKHTEDTWTRVNSKLEPTEAPKEYSFCPDRAFIQKIKINSTDGPGSQVIQDIRKTGYLSKITGLDFNGTILNQNDLQELSNLLESMRWLDYLNLSIIETEADYSAIVPALKGLQRLQKLDITNCGISNTALGTLRQSANIEIINPAPKVVELPPAPPPSVAPTVKVVNVVTETKSVSTKTVLNQGDSRLLTVDVIQARTITHFSDGKKESGPWGEKKNGRVVSDLGASGFPQAYKRGKKMRAPPKEEVKLWWRAHPGVGHL